MLIRNIDKEFDEAIISTLKAQNGNPIFRAYFRKKANAIDVLNAILVGEAYPSNVALKYVYTGYDEFVVLLTNGMRIYKNKVTCVSGDSVPTMIKEVMRDLFPDF